MILQEDDKPFNVILSDESFETYELDPPPYTLKTTKKELKRMYYDMVSIRYKVFWNNRVKMVILIQFLGEWKWAQTDCIKRRRSEASAISPPVKKPLQRALSTPSPKKTPLLQPIDVTASPSCGAAPLSR